MSENNRPHPQKYRRWLAASLPIFLVILSLACSLPASRRPTPSPVQQVEPPTAAPQATPTQRPLPPALVESDPPQGAELPLQSLITLVFNQPMDRLSVEAALKVHAFLISELVWSDDATVSINPGQELPPDSDLSIQVDTQARSAGGLSLSEPISLTYRTVGYLLLSQKLPEPDARDVNPTSAVVASFNHPVVPLGADPAALMPAFSLQPTANGRGEWVNTSTYIFYPDPALAGGQAYTVQVDANLHGVDGNPLETTAPWGFTTAMPRIESVLPADAARPVGLEDEVIFTFNQPMDSASVEANFRLLDPAGNAMPGQFKWGDNGAQFTWKPDNPLLRDTRYTLELDGQAQALGGASLGRTYQANLDTVSELRVSSSQPARGGVLENYTGVILKLSGPILTKDLAKSITVEPSVANLFPYWNEEDRSITIYGNFQPSTAYRLSVSPDLSDAWGSTLGGAAGTPYTLDFRSAPLPPGISVGAGGDTHFLTPQDRFLVAQVSGIASLPVSLGSLPLNDFLTMLGPNGYELRQYYHSADERSWQQATSVDPDRADDIEISLTPDQASLPSGLYFMRLEPRGENLGAGTHLIVVSNAHLTFKLSATDALVWAVDLRSGAPLANTPVTLYDWNGQTLASGQTDAQGIYQATFSARSDPYAAALAVIGQPGDETFAASSSEWSRDIEPWSFNLSTNYQGPIRQAYLYSDRPIYRPGQTVYFRGVVREGYNGRYQIPDIKNAKVKLYDDQGQEIDALDLPLSSFGTLHGEFALPADLRPGSYSLSIPDLNYSSISIPVADYRKPEINLQVEFNPSEVRAGENLEALVNARYFFDAPAGNLPLEWSLYSQPSYFDLPGYAVGLQGASQLYNSRQGMFGYFSTEGKATTKPDGTISLDLGSSQVDPARQMYTLEVTGQDESGLPVSARAQIQINPAEFYIGVRPDTWVSREGEALGFDVQTAKWDKSPAGNQNLRAEFSKVAWVVDDSQPPDPFFGAVYKPDLTLVASTDFRSGSDGKARLEFTPPEPGPYQLSVYSLSAGQPARSEIIVWVGGAGQFTLPNPFNRHIILTADQNSYKPGDTAKVFLPNPFSQSAQALITIERATVLSYQIQNIEPGGSTLSLPISSDDAPNIYISVTLLAQDAQGRPDFRQGYINLPVEPVELTLNVQITRSPEIAGPGETVDFEIQVSDAAGQPVQGEFSLAVVDLAALALADPNSLDILPNFYGNQPLGVRTSLPLSVDAARKIERPQGGGGGGGGDGGITTVRERFPDTAFWQADVVTDVNGKAQINLTLPDSLTTWRVQTRGLTSDTRVGQAETQVVTTKDLLVRPVTPRFLVAGDHLELAAIVQNNTDQDMQGEASLQADGFRLDETAAARQPFNVPANGRARVSWWGSVLDQPVAKLIFSASTNDGALQDAARPALGDLSILHFAAPQTFRTAGVLDEEGQRLELISLPRFFDASKSGPNSGSLSLELAPSLAAAMLKALQVLEETECSCTELAISRFLPNLEMYRTFQQFGLQAPAVQAELTRNLETGLTTLLNRQNFDGGWSWQPGGQSDAFMTAYALFGLTRARGANILSNDQPIQRAIEYLNTNLATQPLPKETVQLDRLAFAYYALANADAGNLDNMQSLYESRASLNPWAQALLALAMERVSPGNQEAHTLLSDLQGAAVRTAAGAHWELIEAGGANMTSTLTNSAIATYALAQRDPGAPIVTEAVRYLTSQRQADGGWTSSYTTAWTLIALNEVIKATSELGGDFNFGANLNDAPVASGQASGKDQLTPVNASLPLKQLYPDSPNLLTIERSPGAGRLYYSAVLNLSRPVDQVQPLSQGLSISRQYFPAVLDCAKEECQPVLSVQPNEKVSVRLTLSVPRDAYHVMVEDYIPAGAEILDTRLKTSQQGQGGEPETNIRFDPRDPFAEGWGWWYFHEASIFDDHIAWSADYLPAGTYELTYTFVPLQAGEFQVLPAHAWEFYFPEVQATSAGGKFEIK